MTQDSENWEQLQALFHLAEATPEKTANGCWRRSVPILNFDAGRWPSSRRLTSRVWRMHPQARPYER